MEFQERAGCSWFSEALGDARVTFPDAARFHDAHGDDLTRCDSWICVCGVADIRGGGWTACNTDGIPVEPVRGWSGSVMCLTCGRIHDRWGFVISNGGRDA